MQSTYHHLTHSVRCHIFAHKANKELSQKAIAQLVGCSQSTISRELKRNASENMYKDMEAHKKAEERRRAARNALIKPEVWQQVVEGLKQAHSPEQIAGRLKLIKGIDISFQTIYRYIRRDRAEGGDLYRYLRERGKKRNKQASSATAGRGLIPGRVGIEDRPASVEKKAELGDWEGDTIVGPRGGSKAALVTLVDRHSKYLLMQKVTNRSKQAVTDRIIIMFKEIERFVKTITFDNGKEFAGHADISGSLQAACYFAQPYHSWERGLNEHSNGLVRGYFPKGTDFTRITHEEIAAVQEKLNNRPRKILGYRTPKEVFFAAMKRIDAEVRLDSS